MLNLLICIVWASKLLDVARGVINRLPVLCDYTDQIEVALVAIPTLLALPILLTKYTIRDYTFYIICVLVYLANFFIYPNNVDSLAENALFCIFAVFPCYFIGRVLDIEKFFTIFVILAGICIVWDVFYFVYFVQSTKSLKEMQSVLLEDNMGAAYLLLPHVIFMIWATMKKFSVVNAMLSIIGTVAILSYGSRGPLACIGVFTIVYFFLLMKFKYSVYIKAGIITLVVIAFSFTQQFALFFKILFTDLNLSTRIIDRVLTGGLANDSGRSWIQDKLYGLLDNSESFFGLGLFGSQRYGIIYSHNFFCDVFITFGYITGALLLLLLLAVYIGGFITCKTEYEKGFILLLTASTLVKLFLSSTFLFEPLFFLLIGFCIKNIVEYKQTLYNKNTADGIQEGHNN